MEKKFIIELEGVKVFAYPNQTQVKYLPEKMTTESYLVWKAKYKSIVERLIKDAFNIN